MNAESTEERSNFTSNDNLLGGHCSLPPSYSIAMMYPPTYNYIKQLLCEQGDTNATGENQLDNENVNYVLERIDKFDKYQQTNQTNDSTIEQSNKLSATSTDNNRELSNQVKTRIPSSLSCSFLNGQIVYLVNTLQHTTTTLGSSMETNLNCGTSLDVKETTPDCSGQPMNANSRVQIISAGNLHHMSISESENNNLILQIDNLNHALIIDEEDASKFNKLKFLINSSNLMLNSFRNIPRSCTSENISHSYLKRFSIRILRRIKSMHNLSTQRTIADV